MKELYRLVLNETDNLRKTSYTLSSKPRSLKILRLFLETGQRDLAKLLSTSQGTIWCLEKGRAKKISERFLEKIFAEFQKRKTLPVPFEELLKREKELSQKGKFQGEYARKMGSKGSAKGLLSSLKSAKPTEQEKEISSFLEQNSIPFERNALIDFGKVRFFCDFAIPNKEKPAFLIEAKRLNTAYRKRLAVFDLAYRALKVKTEMPEVKMVAVIDGSLLESDRKILEEEYSKVLDSSQKQELLLLISSDWPK